MTDAPKSQKRAWLAIGLATGVAVISYASLLVAIVASSSETPEASGPVYALGFALVPVAFVTLAFVSGRRNAAMAVLKAMGLWLVIALPFGLANPVFGLSVGFGMGGVLTLKEHATDSWKARTVAVWLAGAYSLVMLFVIPALGVVSAGLLPFASLGLADSYTEFRGRVAAGPK